MATNAKTSPAKKAFCVWADDIRRVHQHVDAVTAKQAYEAAKQHPECWLPCDCHDNNGYRLSNEVQDLESEDFVQIDGTTHCKTCASHLVESINDSFFRDGECGACEYRRYRTQAPLLNALVHLLKETVETDIAYGIELTVGEVEARAIALGAIAEATNDHTVEHRTRPASEA